MSILSTSEKLASADLAKTLYKECKQLSTSSTTASSPEEAILLCLTQALFKETASADNSIRKTAQFTFNMTIVYAAALTFFMQAGFAMVCTGAVRKKNLQNTMLKNLLDACGAAVAFWAIGFALALGDDKSNPNAFIGTSHFFTLEGGSDASYWVFQYGFSAAAATIVAGALAERCKMSAYFLYSIFLSGFVYPIIVHSIWSPYGFLSADRENGRLFGVGVTDVGGGGVVHMTGGVTALVATHILGPRRGRYHDELTGAPLETPQVIKGHSLALQALGTMFLWFGWYGFNSGSAFVMGGFTHGDHLASTAHANTTIAASAAGFTLVIYNFWISGYAKTKAMADKKKNEVSVRHIVISDEPGQIIDQSQCSSVSSRRRKRKSYDLVSTMNGVLGGLVAITTSCGVVKPWAAMIIGSVGGCSFLIGSKAMVRFRLDDAVDAAPVHFVCGMWAMLAPGLFATPELLSKAHDGRTIDRAGLFYSGNFAMLGAQIVGAIFILVWTTVCMIPFFLLLEKFGHLRATALAEVEGLDNQYFDKIQNSGNEVVDIEQVAFRIQHKLDRDIKRSDKNRSSVSGLTGSRASISGDGLSVGAVSSLRDDPSITPSRGEWTHSSTGSRRKAGASVDLLEEISAKGSYDLDHDLIQYDSDNFDANECDPVANTGEDEAKQTQLRNRIDQTVESQRPGKRVVTFNGTLNDNHGDD